MDEFSIEMPPDVDFHNAIISSLSSDPSIEFRESRIADLVESEGALPEVIANILTFPTAMAFAAALIKHLSPIVTEFIKGRQIIIKINDMEIHATNMRDIERAITAASDLSKITGRKQSLKSKK